MESYSAEEQDIRFEQWVQRGYGEFGLTQNITAFGQLAFTDRSLINDDGVFATSGIGEAEIGAAFGWRPHFGQAAQWRLAYRAATRLAADGRQMGGQDPSLQLAAGRAWSKNNAFVDLQAGYRQSLGRDADSLTARATLGLRRGRAMLLGEIELERGLQNAEAFGADFDLAQLALSGVVPLTRRGALQFGARRDIAVRNLTPGSSVFVSWWWQT
ncbi:MAG: hypothetical protein V2I43_28610 [Parvularcula sp.]|nr:hypothetical protein [Parvularcula sp.]